VTGIELPIAEPALLERLAMSDIEFGEYVRGIFSAMPARTYEGEALARALGYPWERPPGSYRLTPGGVEPLERMSPAERDAAIGEYTAVGDARLPLLAIGSNGAPEVLERKFAHFPGEDDRTVLVLTGHLHDFDVGFAAQPALYGSMPATLFPSPGTAVCVALLWVTPAQLTQLTWSELSYRLGRLEARFEVNEGGAAFDQALVFVSRFGAFCVDGEPVALAAIPASGRGARELTQEQALDAAAELAFGAGATAETLVRALFEDLEATLPKLVATVNPKSQPFSAESWAPFGAQE
jgi:hypothetical protein